MEYTATELGNYQFDFPRITVVLGANGSGKSTLLRGIKDQFPSVYVEGGRTIQISDTVQLNRSNFNEYQHFDRSVANYKGKRKQKLVDRLFDAIMVLIQQEQVIKDSHSDAILRWDNDGRNGEPPKREQLPLERLFEQYNEVFPHLHLSFNKSNGQLTVSNDNSSASYGPSGLSDGEKQVFSLLADMLQLEDEYSIVVADEPELNLHPELAERLWALLEAEYQEKHFLYATHSIQFALRSNVDALYVISPDPSKTRKIENLDEIPRADLEKFLGGVPGILNAEVVLATEGHEKSFDSLFYRWLMSDSKAEIFPCGNCDDVKQVVGKRGLWAQVSSDIKLSGVIDSDYRSDRELQRLESEGLTVLPFHEAESYICFPSVFVAAAEKIGSREEMPTESSVEQIIFSQLQEQSLSIALKRSFSASYHTAGLSLERSILRRVTTKDEAMEHIRNKSAEEVRKATEAMSEKIFEEKLDAELAAIEKVIQEKDTLKALRYIPGKELLEKIAPMAGCRNGTDLMRSIKRNLQASAFDPTKKLAEQLGISCVV